MVCGPPDSQPGRLAAAVRVFRRKLQLPRILRAPFSAYGLPRSRKTHSDACLWPSRFEPEEPSHPPATKLAGRLEADHLPPVSHGHRFLVVLLTQPQEPSISQTDYSLLARFSVYSSKLRERLSFGAPRGNCYHGKQIDRPIASTFAFSLPITRNLCDASCLMTPLRLRCAIIFHVEFVVPKNKINTCRENHRARKSRNGLSEKDSQSSAPGRSLHGDSCESKLISICSQSQHRHINKF